MHCLLSIVGSDAMQVWNANKVLDEQHHSGNLVVLWLKLMALLQVETLHHHRYYALSEWKMENGLRSYIVWYSFEHMKYNKHECLAFLSFSFCEHTFHSFQFFFPLLFCLHCLLSSYFFCRF